MKLLISFLVCMLLCGSLVARAFAVDDPKPLPKIELSQDVRLKPPKDLNGYFPFQPPNSKAEWEKRSNFVKRQLLVALGLDPLPTKTPLNAVVHGRLERADYSVEKVYFESFPGLYVTGNLYRPRSGSQPHPVVLFAHGHWKDARLSEETPDRLRAEIASGQERFERGGRSRFQSMCVQLARMGCIVWQWDMLSDSDATQLSEQVVHRFAQQRAEMNKAEGWGLYSPQAESHLQSVLGLQIWNAIRSVDFVSSLPEVDTSRIAITGASGGGTQTMLLAAVDSRIDLSFPAVMVSTAMQGGCTCENASLLRVNTGNVEFAALFAPKPQGMTTANDWTKEMSTKGFPELQKLYDLLGAPKHVMLHRGEHFPHNYNSVARSAFFTWLNQHFRLGFPEPVIEGDYEPFRRDELSVWDAAHPSPQLTGDELERSLLKWWSDDAREQLREKTKSVEGLGESLRSSIEIVVGRTFETAGESQWELNEKHDRGNYVEMSGLLKNQTYNEVLPLVWLYPKTWKGNVIIWLTESGKGGLFEKNGTPRSAVKKIVEEGGTVVGVDLLFQGDFLSDGSVAEKNRVVNNPREAPAYTYGYNHTLLAQRAHDVLTVARFIRKGELESHPAPKSIALIGMDGAGLVGLVARAVMGRELQGAAISTKGFRFGKLLDYREPRFLPGGSKYLDVPGFLAAGEAQPLWISGEHHGDDLKLIQETYRLHNAPEKLVIAADASDQDMVAADWILTSINK